MSLSPITIDGSLSFSPDEVEAIERGNLLPEGRRILRVEKVELTEEVRDKPLCDLNWGEGSGLMLAAITFKADPEYDEGGEGKLHTENLRFIHPSVDIDSFDNTKLSQMHQIALRSIVNIVKAADIDIPFNEETGKQDYSAALTENLVGARLQAVCKHAPGKTGGMFARLSGLKAFEE